MENEYDFIIIGGGCAGYPAAVYAARYNLKTLLITKERGGLITSTHLVENYPGFPSLSGPELAQKLEEHVNENNVEIVDDIVDSVEKDENGLFNIKTNIRELNFKAKAVLLATGSKHKKLGAPGEDELQTGGVSYCATCDAAFFKNKTVGIVGGSDSATKEAFVLAQNAQKVYMFIRTHLKAEPINADRIRKYDNVEIIEGVEVEKINGDKVVESVTLNKEINGSKEIQLNGVFISIGLDPQNELAKNLSVELNEKQEIKANMMGETNVEGVFAAGDNTNVEWKQAIMSAAQGSAAAHSAFEYINKKF